MLRLLAKGFLALALSSVLGHSAETNRVRIVSFSPQIDGATASDASAIEYDIDITTLNNGELNGELALAPEEVPFDMASYLVMESPFTTDPIYLYFGLNLPPLMDVNENGIDDFYDQGAAVEAVQVNGAYVSPVSEEPVPFTAVWNRESGSLTGTLSVNIPDLGLSSVHVFRLLQFTGAYAYEPEGEILQGEVHLVNEHDEFHTLSGPLNLAVLSTNSLDWQSGQWSSSNLIQHDFSPFTFFERTGDVFTAYFGVLDGGEYTSGQDYLEWMIFLDAEDDNENAVPDLVEASGPIPPAPPRLEIAKVAEGIQLTIHGTAGLTYALESAETVPGEWTLVQLVALDAAAGTVELSAEESSRFYRLKIE